MMIRPLTHRLADAICDHEDIASIKVHTRTIATMFDDAPDMMQFARTDGILPTFMHVPMHPNDNHSLTGYALTKWCECSDPYPPVNMTAYTTLAINTATGRCTRCDGAGTIIIHKSDDWKDE